VSFVYSISPAAVRIDEGTGNQLKLEYGAVARDSTGKMAGNFSKVVEGKMSEAQARQVREKDERSASEAGARERDLVHRVDGTGAGRIFVEFCGDG